MLGLPRAGGSLPLHTGGCDSLHTQYVHGLSRVVAREDPQTTVLITGDTVRANTQGVVTLAPPALEISGAKNARIYSASSSFFSGRAPPSLRKSCFLLTACAIFCLHLGAH